MPLLSVSSLGTGNMSSHSFWCVVGNKNIYWLSEGMRPVLWAPPIRYPQIGFITPITCASGMSVAPPVPTHCQRWETAWALPSATPTPSNQVAKPNRGICTPVHLPSTSQTRTLGVTPMKEFGSLLTPLLPASLAWAMVQKTLIALWVNFVPSVSVSSPLEWRWWW